MCIRLLYRSKKVDRNYFKFRFSSSVLVFVVLGGESCLPVYDLISDTCPLGRKGSQWRVNITRLDMVVHRFPVLPLAEPAIWCWANSFLTYKVSTLALDSFKVLWPYELAFSTSPVLFVPNSSEEEEQKCLIIFSINSCFMNRWQVAATSSFNAN